MPAPPQLKYAILELGLRCNLRCIHCAADAGKPRPRELGLEDWAAVVGDLARLDCGAVDLMGGEVMLSPLLLPVGRRLLEAGIFWGMLTNGWSLTRARAEELTTAGCRGIGVSLDGARAETHDGIRGRNGSWQRALAALEVVAGLDFKARNRTVLTSISTRNLHELEALGQLLSDRFPGLRWQLNLCSAEAPRLPAGLRLGPEEIQRVVRLVDGVRRGRSLDLLVTTAHDVGYYMDGALDLADHGWSGCPAGIHHLGVQSDGQVKGCLALDASLAVGSVRAVGLAQIWADERRWAAWRAARPADLGPNCQGCPWGAECRGGCTAYSLAHTALAHNHPHCLWREAEPEVKARQTRAVVRGTAGTPYGGGFGDSDVEESTAQTVEAAEYFRGAAVDARAPYALPLLSACVELTLRCNLRCLHCGSAAGRARTSEMDLACFVDLFRDLRLLGGQRVVLLGGEPLLHPDWEAITRLAVGFGLDTALVTNGLQVTEDAARRLAALGVTHLGVSIDGASDEVHDRIRGVPGARLRAWTGVVRLEQAGLPVTVITTLSQDNVGELAAMRDQLAAHGGLVWQLQAANGTGERFRAESLLRPDQLLEVARFIQQTRQDLSPRVLAVAGGHNIGHHGRFVGEHGTAGTWRGCPGGVTAVGICSDGSVKGCLSMDPDQVVGNIHQTPLPELWRGPFFARARISTPGRLQGGCARCPHGSTCRAGCPQMARAATGQIWDNPLCIRQAEELEPW